MLPLRDKKCYITFVRAHTHTHTHTHTCTDLEDIVKGSHEHVVEVMRHMHVAVADLGIWEGEGTRYGRVSAHCSWGGGGGGGGGL